MVGPHRDDFSLLVNNVDMGTYASRGQARTLALSLRLAEAAYLVSITGEGPIVLLDDVLSEMDSFRRSQVLEKVVEYQQVIITSTDPLSSVLAGRYLELAQTNPLSDGTHYEVKGGKVSMVTPAAYSR